jgi:putative transposase
MSKRRTSRSTRRIYKFIKDHRKEYDVQLMCRTLDVTRSGYYARLRKPRSDRAVEDDRLLRLIRAPSKASHGIYGPPRIFLDLRESLDFGYLCGVDAVAAYRSSASSRH